MFNFLLLLLPSLIIATGAMFYFKGRVTIREFCTQIGIVALFIVLCLGLAYRSRTADTEVWNGQITSKARNEVSCRHSYSCNCYETVDCSGLGSSRSCSTTQHCSTCYEHSHDVDWDIYASTKESVSINTVDRQGLQMPPRWGVAYIGEPWSSQHEYVNYIKANPESVLFGTKGDLEKFGKWIPHYNSEVYDYYHHDPVINMGVPLNDLKVWNWLLGNVNKQLGPTKQVNVNLIFVPTSDRAYMLALKDAWMGGKKNDVDIVIGSVNGKTIDWADVMSWSPSGEFKVDIKNRLQDIGTLDRRDDIQAAIYDTTKNEFVRMHMKDMKYLIRSFQPSRFSMWVIFILATLIEIGITYRAVTNDVTDDDPSWSNYGESKI